MSKQVVYEVLIHTLAQQLPTILGTIEGAATLVYVRPTQEAAKQPVKPPNPVPNPTAVHATQPQPGWASKPMFPRNRRYAHGKRDKGVKGDDLVLGLINSEPKRTHSKEDIQKLMVDHDFAASSHSPVLTGLVNQGKIRRVAPGLFAPLGLVVRMPAAGVTS